MESKHSAHDGDDFLQAEVRTLRSKELEDLGLVLITGMDGLDRIILKPRVQKPGLAFAGYYEYIKPGRVQIIGASEVGYLESLPARLREKRIRDVASLDVSCFVATKGITPLPELVKECENHAIPLFRTDSMSSTTITRITYYLEETLAPKISIHGVLLDVYGIGVLVVGDSGVGKSESALELVWRGHRLIADDLVLIKRHPNEVLIGYASTRLPYHMELRGIGIIGIRDMFGISSTRELKPIDLVVRLERWVEGIEYDRLGIAGELFECLNVPKPLVRLPVASGRNLALLIEIAARNHIMKLQGHNTAEAVVNIVNQQIERREHETAGAPDEQGNSASIREKHLIKRSQYRKQKAARNQK